MFFHNCGNSNLLLSGEHFAVSSGIMGLIIAHGVISGDSGQKALRVIQALRSLNLHPAPGSMILLRGWPYRSDPFWSNGWNTVFIASLVYNDHSVRVYHRGTNELRQDEIAKMDYVISVDEFHAELNRAPTPE